ncbi:MULTISPECIES: hypothetical protein [Halorussus]|uniref:hypothetical protein n=1 Tax=Halorussus TaxID=1070314 RepID=UPI00209DD065|nr:hypothetical protein [Halorussus vallis]USZ74151.1 hypothetical protein NGM07_11885 [Halorussus vallis]
MDPGPNDTDGVQDRETIVGPEVTDDRSKGEKAKERLREFVLLHGSRPAIAAGLLVPFFVVLASIELVITSTTQQVVPLFYLSSAVIGGTSPCSPSSSRSANSSSRGS